MHTSIVSEVRSFSTASGVIIPFLSAGIEITFQPHFFMASACSRTAGCSIELMRIVPFEGLFKRERRGIWSLSVPPEVKKMLSGFTPIALALRVLASSSKVRAFFPTACVLDGFPQFSSVGSHQSLENGDQGS